MFDTSQADEDSGLVTSHHTEDSVASLAWYSKAGAGDQLAILTHTEQLQLWRTEDDAAQHIVLSRAALCHGIRRSAPQHTYLAGLHAREEGLLVLAGSSYTSSPCLRLALVKSRKAKPVADLGAAGGATVRCSLMMEEGALLTGGEDGVIRLWREGGEGEGAEVKAESGKVVTKSKVRDKPY